MVREWPCPRCGRVFSIDITGLSFPYLAHCSGCQNEWSVQIMPDMCVTGEGETTPHAHWWE
jgi:hypothetical protein